MSAVEAEGTGGLPGHRGAPAAPGSGTNGPAERGSAGPGAEPSHSLAPAPATPGAQFEQLLAVMDTLRSPGGCPWDAEQTHESLLRYLVEEAYEVVEAVESLEPSARRRDELVEELGDVLLQVVFHARIGQEHEGSQRFDVTDVVTAVTEKLVRRHPGVFDREPATAAPEHPAPEHPAPEHPSVDPAGQAMTAGARTEDATGRARGTGTGAAGAAAGEAASSDGRAPSTAELAARWDAVKRDEKPQRTRVFDGIPPALPALALAEKALSKARRHGVPGVTPVDPGPSSERREREERELGDELLRRIDAASARGLDAERALRGAVRRFVAENDGPLDR